MQHKRRAPLGRYILILLVLVIVGGSVALMTAKVPAPQQPIEKELDAKTFLEPKPQP